MAWAFFASALAWLMKAERRGAGFDGLTAKGAGSLVRDGGAGGDHGPLPALSTQLQSRNLQSLRAKG